MSAPALSFVLALDRFATGAETVRALARQTVAGRIELVLAGPAGLEPDGEAVRALHSVRVIEAPLVPLTLAQAYGVRAAGAPLVLIGETHAFPDEDCVERVLEAFAAGEHVVAVVSEITNANPRTARSWANLLVTYGRWIGAAGGAVTEIPSHNAAFRRDALLALGSTLPDLLDNGGGVDRELRAEGGMLVLEPRARLSHLNVARPRGWLGDRYWAARVFGAARSRSWSPARRAAYCAGAPLIPLVFLSRVFRSPGWTSVRAHAPRGVVPAVVVSMLAITAGEVAGYAAGMGRAQERVLEYELHRARYC